MADELLYIWGFSGISWKEGRKEIFYLTTHSTHFIYGYMEVLHIWRIYFLLYFQYNKQTVLKFQMFEENSIQALTSIK